jgi:two-component system, chemotaxis family, protein-glutamate methylesterase/glutaminase
MDADCDVHVVAIGASAGGIPALTVVLAALGPEFPGAIVVVLHLARVSAAIWRECLRANRAFPSAK